MVIGNAGKWLRAQWHNILLKFEASVLRPLAMLGNGYELNGNTYFLSLSYWLSAHSSSSRSILNDTSNATDRVFAITSKLHKILK